MGTGERAQVRVPALVGSEIVPAYRIALIAGVAMTGHNPDTPLPLRGVIDAQHPAAGTSLRSGDPVTVWLQPAAPRAPQPDRRASRAGRAGRIPSSGIVVREVSE